LAIVKLDLIQKQDCSELTRDNCPDEECQPKYGHHGGLCHERKPQLRDLEPEKWQLEDNEDEEAEHLCRTDVRAGRYMIWEALEGGSIASSIV